MACFRLLISPKDVAAGSTFVLAAAVGVLARWAKKSCGSDSQQSSKNSS